MQSSGLLQISFIVLQAVAICGLLKPGCSFSSQHQKTEQKQDLRDDFPVPDIMFLLPKQLKNYSLGFICKFTCSLKYLPCVRLLAYDLCKTALCFGAREAPAVETACQQSPLFVARASHFEPLMPPHRSMKFEVAPAFLCRIILTCFLKMVCFLQIYWKKTSLSGPLFSCFR